MLAEECGPHAAQVAARKGPAPAGQSGLPHWGVKAYCLGSEAKANTASVSPQITIKKSPAGAGLKVRLARLDMAP